MGSFVKLMRLNYFALMIVIMGLSISCSIKDGYAAEDVPDVFSEVYFDSNAQLTPDSDVKNFKFISHEWINEFVKNIFTRFSMLSFFDRDFCEEEFTKMEIEEEPFANIRQGFPKLALRDRTCNQPPLQPSSFCDGTFLHKLPHFIS